MRSVFWLDRVGLEKQIGSLVLFYSSLVLLITGATWLVFFCR